MCVCDPLAFGKKKTKLNLCAHRFFSLFILMCVRMRCEIRRRHVFRFFVCLFVECMCSFFLLFDESFLTIELSMVLLILFYFSNSATGVLPKLMNDVFCERLSA